MLVALGNEDVLVTRFLYATFVIYYVLLLLLVILLAKVRKIIHPAKLNTVFFAQVAENI